MPADLNDYFNKKRGSSGGGDDNGGESKGPKVNFKTPDFKGFGKISAFAYVIIALVAVIALTQPFVTINSGEVGIKSNLGKYDPSPMQPGLHFFIPFLQKVIVVDTRVRLINYTSGEDMGEAAQKYGAQAQAGIIRKNSISVLDARNLPVSIDITVQYRLNPENAPLFGSF